VPFSTPLKPKPAMLPELAAVIRREPDPAVALGVSAGPAAEIVVTPVAVIGVTLVTSTVPLPS
jgi:hypothetical protein